MADHDAEALLDIISPDTFDDVTDRLVEKMNTSRDASKIYRLLDVVYERAIDAAEAPDMYARLLRRMMDRVSPDIHDGSIKSVDGTPLVAGRLFLRYLLSLVQKEFERITAKAWADDDGIDQVEQADSSSKPRISRRRGLEIVKLVGGLFEMDMLTERVVHQCLQKLLPNTDSPRREDIERFCSLLTSVSKRLDSTRADLQMNVYFARIYELIQGSRVDLHMQQVLSVSSYSCGTSSSLQVSRKSPSSMNRTGRCKTQISPLSMAPLPSPLNSRLLTRLLLPLPLNRRRLRRGASLARRRRKGARIQWSSTRTLQSPT
jgi:translation initiation factor 4G